MKGVCIYCGQNPTTKKGDHVPPQCFFGDGRSHSLIQVPCCKACNNIFSRDDERARNLIVSTEVAEPHPLVESQLRHKRNRSWVKTKPDGTIMDANLKHMLSSSSLKPRFEENGAFLDMALSLNFDQPVVHRFLDRMTRALHHHRYQSGYIVCEIIKGNSFYEELTNYIETHRPAAYATFGDDAFFYADFTFNHQRSSLWFLRFLGGVEFWTSLRLLEAS